MPSADAVIIRPNTQIFPIMRQTVFIADLHLSDDTPDLNRLFLQALKD